MQKSHREQIETFYFFARCHLGDQASMMCCIYYTSLPSVRHIRIRKKSDKRKCFLSAKHNMWVMTKGVTRNIVWKILPAQNLRTLTILHSLPCCTSILRNGIPKSDIFLPTTRFYGENVVGKGFENNHWYNFQICKYDI